MPLFTHSHTYHSVLSPDELLLLVSGLLEKHSGGVDSVVFTGKMTTNGFDIRVNARGRFPVRIKAELVKEKDDTLVKVVYRPAWNPLFMLVPVYALCVWGLVADSFVLNGELISFNVRLLFLLTFAAVQTLVIGALSVGAVNKVRKMIEEELRIIS